MHRNFIIDEYQPSKGSFLWTQEDDYITFQEDNNMPNEKELLELK